MAKLMTGSQDAEQKDGAHGFGLNSFRSWHLQTNPTCGHSHSVLHNRTETETNLKIDNFSRNCEIRGSLNQGQAIIFQEISV